MNSLFTLITIPSRQAVCHHCGEHIEAGEECWVDEGDCYLHKACYEDMAAYYELEYQDDSMGWKPTSRARSEND